MRKRHWKKLARKIQYFADPAFAQLLGIKCPANIPATQGGVAAPLLDMERGRHKKAFRQSCIEVLGEDPETDWNCMEEY